MDVFVGMSWFWSMISLISTSVGECCIRGCSFSIFLQTSDQQSFMRESPARK